MVSLYSFLKYAINLSTSVFEEIAMICFQVMLGKYEEICNKLIKKKITEELFAVPFCDLYSNKIYNDVDTCTSIESLRKEVHVLILILVCDNYSFFS